MSISLRPSQALRLWQQVTLSEVRDDAPDLTMRQMAILLTIYLEPPPHTVRGLAARLQVTKPVITRALDTMGAPEAGVAAPRRARPAQRAGQAHGRRCPLCRALRRCYYCARLWSCRFDCPRPASSCLQAGSRRRPRCAARSRPIASSPAGRPASSCRSPMSCKEPSADAGLSTQLLLGEDVTVFDETGGWAWVQARASTAMSAMSRPARSALVGAPCRRMLSRVPRTFIYPGPDLKLPRTGAACPWARRSR